MLSKILFTIAVVAGVIVWLRQRRPARAAEESTTTTSAAAAATTAQEGRSIPPRVIAYALLGALGGVALLIVALES